MTEGINGDSRIETNLPVASRKPAIPVSARDPIDALQERNKALRKARITTQSATQPPQISQLHPKSPLAFSIKKEEKERREKKIDKSSPKD